MASLLSIKTDHRLYTGKGEQLRAFFVIGQLDSFASGSFEGDFLVADFETVEVLDGQLCGFRGIHEDKGVVRLESASLGLLNVNENVSRGNREFVGSEEIDDLVDGD